jgi:hypothetical protein
VDEVYEDFEAAVRSHAGTAETGSSRDGGAAAGGGRP